MKRVKSGREIVGLLELELLATKEQFVTIQKKLSFDAFSDVVKTTPVDAGLARSNWRIGVNKTDESDPTTAVDKKLFSSKFKKPAPSNPQPTIEFGDMVSVYNNTVYIGELEDGSSNQAPNGMVAGAAQRARLTAQRLAESLSREKSNV